MPTNDLKQNIANAIHDFQQLNLAEASIKLFETLGYNTQRRLNQHDLIFDDFEDAYINDKDNSFNYEAALYDEWLSISLLFQLGEDELQNQNSLFSNQGLDQTLWRSYLFFALELSGSQYSKTKLSNITREINRLFKIPVMLLFKHGNSITFAVINRRPNQVQSDKIVVEKVSLIKDIRLLNTHRAHINILENFAIENIFERNKPLNFNELHNKWTAILNTSELNKRFYRDLSNWYFWAKTKVSFPDDIEKDEDKRNAVSMIRLITRVMFIWFIKEKDLVPESLFERNEIKKLLKNFDPESPEANDYYLAILQNLFFATLNQNMDERAFATEGTFHENRNENGIKNIYRYADKFKITKEEVLQLFAEVPFLNGGLFDCLDKEDDNKKVQYADGFSRNPKKRANVPDYLFFQAQESLVDLSKTLDDKKKNKEKVRGLFEILNSYKFTVAENTPLEEEVALDPELLGKVFENLLASYNPETKSSARKQTGSFYTPREIVDYMVDESIKAYLSNVVEVQNLDDVKDTNTSRLDNLLSYTATEAHDFSPTEVAALVAAINNMKILDPAVGSGAFPMGILQKLVLVLNRLDPDNTHWKALQQKIAIEETKDAYEIGDKDIRNKRLEEISEIFDTNINEHDYARKLYLIENCIYGVDIQAIAVQISKLRFFISLIIDQNKQANKPNYGIRSLPNLETKFVAANTLIGLEKPTQLLLRNPEMEKQENKLKALRHRYFSAKTRKDKMQYQNEDKALRQSIAELLVHDGWQTATAQQIVAFDPYNQNASAPFFDLEWMFGMTDGFDVVIGNPPYVFARGESFSISQKKYFYHNFKLAKYQINLYSLFIEKSDNVLSSKGTIALIIPNNWLTINTNKDLREFVLKKGNVKIVNFYKKVFETANVDSSILIYSKATINSISLFEYNKQIEFISNQTREFFLNKDEFIINLETFKNDDFNNIIDKIESKSLKLKEVAIVKAGLQAYEIGKGVPIQTQKMKEDRVYHSIEQCDDRYIKYLDGQDVCRYQLKWSNEYLQYGNNLASPRKDFNLFSSKRILVRQIPSKKPYCINACYTDEIILNDRNSMNIVYMKYDPKYILALLNSKLISFWFIHKFGKMQRGIFPQFKINELEIFPIFNHSTSSQAPFIALVDKILEGKKAGLDTSAWEAEIDEMVYALYELTPEEIAIVEGR